MPWTCTVWSSVWLKVPWKFMNLFWNSRFMADSWHFHGTLTATPNMDAQQFHGTFMAEPDNCDVREKVRQRWSWCRELWRFIFEKFHESAMNLPNLDETDVSDSWQIHGTFFQFQKIKTMSDSCHFHESFMAVSWHFHIQAWPGYSLPKSIEEMIQKVGFSCRFDFLLWFQSHFWQYVRFMLVSWPFHGTFFILIFVVFSWKNTKQQLKSLQEGPSSLNVRCIANSSRIPGTLMSCMALSCQLHGYLGFMSLSWHFLSRESAMKVPWNCHETVLSSVWLKVWSLWHFLSNPQIVRHFHGTCMADSWHEGAMKMIWIWHEHDTVALASFHGRFVALSLHFQPNRVPNSAGSWHVRSTFP